MTLALALGACGGVGGGDDGGDGADGGGSSQGGGGDKASGRVTTFGFTVEDVIAKERVSYVKEQHPELDLKVASGAFDEQQFLSAVASGSPPDAVYLDRAELGTYAAKGALAPLDDCLADNDVDLDVFRDSALTQVTYDGQVYGVPEFNSVRIVMGSADVMRQNGVTEADLDTSDWSHIQQVTDQLVSTSGGKLETIGFDPKIPEFFPLWVAANGGRHISEDGMTPQLDSPEAVEALEYTVGLVDQQGGWEEFKAFRDTWDFFGDENQFVTNQAGAFPMEDWYLDVLADVSPDVDLASVPFLGRDGEPLTYASGNAWAVPEGASNPEAACAFAATMTETEAWVAAAEASKQDRQSGGGEYLGTWTANEEADARILEEVYEPTGVKPLDDAVQAIRDVQDVAITDPPSPAGAEVK